MAKAKGGNTLVKLGQELNPSIFWGLNLFASENPIFFKKENFLFNYIDAKKAVQFYDKFKTQSANTHNGTADPQEVASKIADYVRRGILFNERGKEIILDKSLYQHKDLGQKVKEFVYGHFPSAPERMEIKDERGIGGLLKSYIPFTTENHIVKKGKLSRTTEAFTELYELMRTGDYAQRMPDLAKAVTQVYDTGFFDVAAKILYKAKLLSPTRYAIMERQISKKAEEGKDYVIEDMANRIKERPQVKIPANYLSRAGVIIGGVGIASLIVNNSITGNIIGATDPNISGLLGGILLIISGILLWSMSKKKNKTQTKKKKKTKRKKKQ